MFLSEGNKKSAKLFVGGPSLADKFTVNLREKKVMPNTWPFFMPANYPHV